MDKRFDKLLASCPAAREVVRAYLYLQATIGDREELKEVQNDIKLAAMHLEDALCTLAAAELPDK